MEILLSKERADWLQRQVAEGRFASIEQAVDAAVSVMQTELERNIDDVWARPMIEEALSSLDRGLGEEWIEGEAVRRLHAQHPDLIHAKNR